MPIIERPADRGPLFGGKAMIVFGGIDKEAMRQWQERIRAAKQENTGTPGDDVNAAADGTKRDDNDGSADPPSPDAEPQK